MEKLVQKSGYIKSEKAGGITWENVTHGAGERGDGNDNPPPRAQWLA